MNHYKNNLLEELHRLTEAVQASHADIAPTYLEYTQLAFAIATDCGEAGRADFMSLCSLSPKHDSAAAEKLFSNALHTCKGDIHLGSVFHLAEMCGVRVAPSHKNADADAADAGPFFSHTCARYNKVENEEKETGKKKHEEEEKEMKGTEPLSPLPYFPQDHDWPEPLKSILSFAKTPAQHDVLLLGAMTVLGASLSHIVSVLLWYAQDAEGSSLNYIDAIDGAVESYIEDDAVISADYTVVDGGDSQLLICSSEKENAEETGRNLYAYVIRDGEVYEPVTLTDLEGYAAVPSGIWNGTAYEYLFTRTDVDITENTVTENTDLCITSVVPQSKLVIGDIDYTQEKLMPDEDTSITIPVKNNGLTNCGEGKVQIVYNGNVIGQADLEAGITSGETQNVTVDLTVPEDAAAKETLKVEAISDKNTTADSTKNIQSAGSELELSVKQEDDDITVAIDNNSAFDTTAALTLKAGDASGKVLKTINLGNVESYGMVEKTFTKEELKKLGSDTVYMEVSGDTEESIKSDNTAFVYVGTEELKTLDYLTATKTKVTYTKGEKLNLNDLEVTAVYTDGSKAKVTGYTTNVKNIDMSKTGKKQLEILYEEVGIGRKVVMPITVENAKPNTPKPDTGKKPSKKVKVTSIRLSGLSKQIAAGKKLTLKAAVLPKTASNKKLLWKSSNTKVATVTQGGVVTLKKKTGGKKVTITATATDGSKKYASWKITSMKGIVKKIKITGSKPVKAGKKLKLKAKVTATKKANKKLLWISGNTKYATVNAKGIVTTKKSAKGKTVKITAMATDGSGKKKTVKIKMK